MARRLRRGLEEERKPRIEIKHEGKGTGTRLSTKQAEYSDSEVLGAVPDVDWGRLTQKLMIAGAMMRHGTLGAGPAARLVCNSRLLRTHYSHACSRM